MNKTFTIYKRLSTKEARKKIEEKEGKEITILRKKVQSLSPVNTIIMGGTIFLDRKDKTEIIYKTKN